MILTIETRLAVATLPHTRTLGMTDQGFQLELKKHHVRWGPILHYSYIYLTMSQPHPLDLSLL